MKEKTADRGGAPVEEDTGEFRFSPRPNRAHEIKWRPWGRLAFEEAEREGRLLLLSISAVWCHWCHVMDETTYSDPAVISRVNSDFIPVRVDSDRRPDINSRYNQGGWPTTAFLTPSGRAVAGLTYTNPAGMLEILGRLSVLYRERRGDFEVEAARAADEERRLFDSFGSDEPPGGDAVERVTESLLESWDRGYGGLGGEPKFPPAGPLELALSLYMENGGEELRSFVISTLDGMSRGELFDRVEGGFFRYATARDWSAPHYEKMLADNAELICVYLKASVALKRPDYRETAVRALEYVLANIMDDQQRGFYGSQDADEKYYHRDREGRERLEKPPVDRTIYTDGTSKMISALVPASSVLDDPGLLAIARRSSDFIWRTGFKAGTGLCHYFDMPEGRPRLWGQAADQVYYLLALEDLYRATLDPEYLDRARTLGELLNRYLDVRGWIGGMNRLSGGESDGSVAMSEIPLETPDIVVNGHAARALMVLDAIAPGGGYRGAAEGILGSFSGRLGAFSHFASGYALAVELMLKGPVEVRVGPDCEGAPAGEMLREAAGLPYHRVVVRRENVEDYMPSLNERPPPAVVCSSGRCIPVYSAGELKRTVGAAAED